jgi:uncharacterized membrane protein YGL010W
MFQLSTEWTRLMSRYEEQHRDPRNRACHRVGIPLIAASIPVGATVVGLPLAGSMLALGCIFQALGHFFEKNTPAFVDDRRNVLVGLLWWLKESGVPIELGEGAESECSSSSR